MDVDGTLTDGRIFMGQDNEIMKSFSVRDGFAIKEMLPQRGILPVIISGRKSSIVVNRCKELGIKYLFEGIKDKKNALDSFLLEKGKSDGVEYSFRNVAYIGDDIPDLTCMLEVKASGGIVGCPQDACIKVRKNSNFVSEYKGGEGAVRDFIEYVINEVESHG